MKKATIMTGIMLIVVTFLALLSTRDLFVSGYYESHDGIIHVMRLAHFYQALHDGQFPVRWLPTWMAGYGSPVFNFNWNLPYYVGSVFHYLGLSLETSIKSLFILSSVLCGISSFIFLRKVTGSSVAALVGSVLYIWAPYRFTDIYIRGALGEVVSFIFFPLIGYLIQIRKNQPFKLSHTFVLGVIWAFFILTHNLMALIGVGLLFVYTLIIDLESKYKGRLVSHFFVSFGIGLCLSAFFWVPSVAEASLIKYLGTYGSIDDKFPKLAAIISSPWKYAYAVPQFQNISMSFQIGIMHLLLPIVALILLCLRKLRHQYSSASTATLFFIMIFLLSIYLSCDLSRRVYEMFPVSRILVLPWRLLEITTFAASYLSAVALMHISNTKIRFGVGVSICIITVILCWPFARIVSYRYNAADSQYFRMVRTNANFLPDTEYSPNNSNYLQLLETEGIADPNRFFTQEDGAQDQKLTIVHFQKQNLTYSALLVSKTVQNIRAATFNFPGWVVTIDGQQVPIKNDKYGLISFEIPTGNHEVSVEFKNTPVRNVANLISLLTALILCLYYVKQMFKKISLSRRKKSVNFDILQTSYFDKPKYF